MKRGVLGALVCSLNSLAPNGKQLQGINAGEGVINWGVVLEQNAVVEMKDVES